MPIGLSPGHACRGERFAHDHHARSAPAIVGREVASRGQPDPHRLEIPGRHEPHPGADRAFHFDRAALGYQAVAAAARAHRHLGRQTGGRNAGSRSHFNGQAREGLGDPVPLQVPVSRQRDPGAQHAGGIEARVDALEVHGRPDQEPGADEQHDRDGDLHRDEAAAQPVAAAGRRSAPAIPERLLQIAPRATERGTETEEEGAQHRDREREPECRQIDGGLVEPGHVLRTRGQQRLQRAVRDRDANDAGTQSQQQVLRHQLPHDPAATGAQRGPYRHFALPGGAARDQQVGHVDAPDQQHESDRAQQHEQLFRGVAHQLVLHRHQPHAQDAAVRERILLHQRQHRPVERRPRLIGRDAGTEPAVSEQVVLIVLRALLGRPGRGNPQFFAGVGEIESLRHHADHRVRHAVEPDRLADEAGVSTEPAGPEPVAQHYHGRRASLVVGLGGHPAEQRGDAEQRKEVPGGPRPQDALGRRPFREIEVRPADRRKRAELGLGPLEIDVVPDRGLVSGAARRVEGDYVDAIGLRKRKRPQHHGVDGAEYGRRAADAQRQGQARDEGEAARLGQRAKAETDVVCDVGQPGGAFHRSIPFAAQAPHVRA